MGFQKYTNLNQAPGVAGSFSSTNPVYSTLAEPGSLISPKGGINVGSFAFVDRTQSPPQVSQSYKAGNAIGFLNRDLQGLITGFLDETSLNVPQGFGLALLASADLWAAFGGGAVAGQAVYADQTTGVPVSGPGATFTASIAPGSGGTGLMTVTAVASGYIFANTGVAGGSTSAGTTVLSQVTPLAAGEAMGGAGRYVVSVSQTVASGALSSPAVQTRWNVVTNCNPGEIAKISTLN